MKNLITLLAFVSSAAASAQVLPTNRMRIPTTIDASGITEAQFNSILDSIDAEYAPIFKSVGATLVMNKLWDNADVNSNADQQGTNWELNIFGGIARHPAQTPDGLRAVVCHEIGHHLGGFPFVGGADWAANEGQADYYATQVCLRRLFANTPELNVNFGHQLQHVDPRAKESCDAAWRNPADQAICHRVAMASYALGKILASLEGKPISFSTPDRSQVTQTNDDHPAAQCRLDTYLEGALCEANANLYDIPGKNAPQGEGSIQAEQAAARVSCTHASRYWVGLRPRCWFFPRM